MGFRAPPFDSHASHPPNPIATGTGAGLDYRSLVLEIDQEPALKVVGDRVVIRHFIRTDTTVEFEMNTTKPTTIWLSRKQSGPLEFSLPAGKHQIRKELE